jgi:serine protease Do
VRPSNCTRFGQVSRFKLRGLSRLGFLLGGAVLTMSLARGGTLVNTPAHAPALDAPASSSGGSELPDPSLAEIHPVMTKVFPALVQVSVVEAESNQGREQKREISGSGVIISNTGYVVTNHHVVGHAKRVWCTLPDREEIDAEVIGTDALADIGVLRLRPKAGSPHAGQFPFARWGDSTKVDVGQKVFALGSPLAISQTVTAGHVANPRMVMPRRWGGAEAWFLDDEPVGSVVRWLLHDAAIAPGNSGGPLVNPEGEIVGINEIGLFPPLGGAIPSGTARPVAESLIKFGKVVRSWVGIEVQPLFKDEAKVKGVRVRSVAPNSSAYRAGVRPGDVITSYQNHPLDIHHAEEVPDFNRMMFEEPVGSEVQLVAQQNGVSRRFTMTTSERGIARATDREFRELGVTGRDLTKLAALDMERTDTAGVYISTVRPGGAAGQAKPPLAEGDLIVGFADHPVSTIAQLDAAIQKVSKSSKDPQAVVVEFERKVERCVTVMTIAPSAPENGCQEARKAWLPATTQVYTPQLAAAQHRVGVHGVRLTYLYPVLEHGPFQVGDILTHVNDEPIQAIEPTDTEVFSNMLRDLKIGVEARFRTLRGNTKLVIPFRLLETPTTEQETRSYRDDRLECTVRDLTPMDRAELKLASDQSGALLKEVSPGGWASVADMKVGDLVLTIDDQRVRDVRDVERILAAHPPQNHNSVKIFLKRRGHTLFTEVTQERE